MHGRDLSGLVGILQPQSMDEKSSMFLLLIPASEDKLTHKCISYG